MFPENLNNLLFLKLGSSFGSIPLSKKVSIGVRAATWSPFEHGMTQNQTITLDLKSNLPNNPFDQMVFTSDLQIDDMVSRFSFFVVVLSKCL